MKTIDLASTGGLESPVSAGMKDPEPYYPSAHITVPEDKGEIEMPDEGTVTFKYRLRRETTVNRPNGKTVCEYDLDLLQLVGYKASPDERPAKSDTSTSDALDALAEEKAKNKAEEEDEGEY